MSFHNSLKQLISKQGKGILMDSKLHAFLLDVQAYNSFEDHDLKDYVHSIIQQNAIASFLSLQKWDTSAVKYATDFAKANRLDEKKVLHIFKSIAYAIDWITEEAISKDTTNKILSKFNSFCPKCGASVASDSNFCSNCGQALKDIRGREKATMPSEVIFKFSQYSLVFSPDLRTLIGTRDCKTFAMVTVTIPEGTITIGSLAFRRCYHLVSVIIPETVIEIEANAFSWCMNLSSVTIPKSVKRIGNGAFAYCTKLSSVVIPDSVTDIGRGVFKECTHLSSINVPDSVKKRWNEVFKGTE